MLATAAPVPSVGAGGAPEVWVPLVPVRSFVSMFLREPSSESFLTILSGSGGDEGSKGHGDELELHVDRFKRVRT